MVAHEETWIWYDGPRLFTARHTGQDGRRYLLAWVDERDYPDLPFRDVAVGGGVVQVPRVSDIYLAAPLTDHDARRLRDGSLTPYNFWRGQDPASCWVLTEGENASVLPFAGAALPAEWLPAPDASYVALMEPRDPDSKTP